MLCNEVKFIMKGYVRYTGSEEHVHLLISWGKVEKQWNLGRENNYENYEKFDFGGNIRKYIRWTCQ